MNLKEFQRSSVPNFRGLYRRGGTTQVPIDHAVDLENLDFNKTGETFTRWGTDQSLNLSHPVTRMFLATVAPGNYYLLTTDGVGNLYCYDTAAATESTIYTNPALVDFYAVNEWGRTYILPAGTSSNNMSMQVLYWDVPSSTLKFRPALGAAPSSSTTSPFTATENVLTGDVPPGVHKFAVSFITDTGFITRPGPENSSGLFISTSVTSSGGNRVELINIPIGPPGTVARQIFVTKADEEEYFYLDQGLINDNTTTTILDLNWFDTDLAVSADDLFDLMESIPGAATTSSGLFKYRGRTLAWSPFTGIDKVLVSNVADPESFDNTTGFIQLPTETDGNYVSGIANLNDVLYFTKSLGIYGTQDNFDNPNTWIVTPVDGGVGCTFYAMSTISISQTSLSINDFLLFADMGGIYIFNGVIQQPPITWKIDDIWKRVNKAAMHMITMAVDPFKQVLYCLVPVDDNETPSLLLVATATDGIDYQNIKWSIYNFPKCARCIGMANFKDSQDFQYLLRFGTDDNGILRLDPAATDDSGTAITSYWQAALQGFEPGSISVFRALRIRGAGELFDVSLGTLDAQNVQRVNSFYMTIRPGMEYARQINYTAEVMSIKLLSRSPMRLSRLDCFGKVQFDSRPLLV